MLALPPPVEVTLRDGRNCLIRPAAPEDFVGLFELERAIVRARHGVVKHEDELPGDVASYADVQVRAGLAATDGSACQLVAELEGRVVGEASILRLRFRMVNHVGVLGIGVLPGAQGLGIGRAMIEHLLAWARSHRDADGGGVRKVELGVRADNLKAVELYRALGFVVEGTRRGLVRADDGTFVDSLSMALFIPR
ncbi:GNAT family N-acetyltransferase [Hyalangium rubrum]|uniref:GNAT family N-acetyltransferase n=1 Tax=Hyalangium rubrum TaxID=3103134 RepID=A0ABU5HC64_9BACT|nr:GNAT family N-acetyltransferase [Hyalangium sp. s54d21]MDY7231053.1 GNAT family N-acetyltransferase [Hyalangium sp. s54d21]